MPTACSLHIGINHYGRGDYVIRPDDLRAAEQDAIAMAAMAARAGFAPTLLIGAAATRDAVKRALTEVAALRAGSSFVLTLSAHGVQIPDRVPPRPRPPSATSLVIGDEPDGFDEAWCLYDGFLLDDELDLHLARCAAGVRIFLLSDSCHSGTMLPTAAPRSDGLAARRSIAIPAQPSRPRPAARAALPRIDASVLHLAACTDAGCAFEGDGHGVFTGAILALCGAGFTRSHIALRDAVHQRTIPLQTPVLTASGRVDVAFVAAPPFTPPWLCLR